jgi:hypothetical protein
MSMTLMGLGVEKQPRNGLSQSLLTELIKDSVLLQGRKLKAGFPKRIREIMIAFLYARKPT